MQLVAVKSFGCTILPYCIKMKLLLLCCLVAAVAEKPPDIQPGNVEIKNYDSYNIGTDGFQFTFEQTDGTKAHAKGKLKKVVKDGAETEALVVKGSYSYVYNGIRYTVKYEADENGYKASMDQSPSDETPGAGYPTGLIPSILG